MDDGVDENFEWWYENIFPTLGIDKNDQKAFDEAYQDYLNDEDFYTL